MKNPTNEDNKNDSCHNLNSEENDDIQKKLNKEENLGLLKKNNNNSNKNVHFRQSNYNNDNQNIELSLNNINDSMSINDTEENQAEDEEKFKVEFYQKRRRKNLNKNNFNREKGFSIVKHQIKQEFSLDKLGRIEWAKEHSSANRPMKKLQQFTKQTKFCNCCNLPCETPGIIECFSSCDDPENFSVCGKGIPLYFAFFRFCIILLILVSFTISIPMTIFNNNNLNEIIDFCTYLKKNNSNFYFKNNLLNYTCEKYLKKNESLLTNSLDWFWKISSDNIHDYEILLNETKKFENNEEGKNRKEVFRSIMVNFSFIGFFCMISLFIINLNYIILLKAKLKLDKKENILPSDYTVLITNLQFMANEFKETKLFPLNENEDNEHNLIEGVTDYEYYNMNNLKTTEGQFTQFLINDIFYNQKMKHKLNLYNVNLCYKLNEFMVLKEKYEKCKYKIFQIENNPYQKKKNKENNYEYEKRRYYTSPFTYLGLNWLYCSNKGKSIEEIYSDLQEYDSKLNLLVNKAKFNNFCGCIFATFNSVKDRQRFYNKYPHYLIEFIIFYLKNIKYYLCCCLFDKKKISKYLNRQRIGVYLSPEPEDILWENMEFNFTQRAYRIIMIYSITFVLILTAFIIVSLLNKLQESIKGEDLPIILKYTASFSITIVISIFNIILEFILKIFTDMEKLKSKTHYYLSYSIKLTIFTLTTSAFVPLISNEINKEKNNLNHHNNKNLISNMLILFLVNSFMTPILWTINIGLIIKKIRIYFIERNKFPNLKHFKTQKELNDLYEYPDMQISSKYSYIFKTVLMSMFFLPIFPLGIVISLSGLVLGYFLEKYNFTHFYKRPEMLNEKLGKVYFNFSIFILLSFCFGNYIFMHDIIYWDSWHIINLVFFAILSILPYTKPITLYFNSNKSFEIDSKPINEVYFSFYNDYQRQNPFTKKEGMYFYITELKKKGYVSKFVYDILLKNIEKINVMEIYYDTCKNPSLTQTQTALARVDNKSSIDDLKRNIKRKMSEREENLELMINKNRVKSDYRKSNLTIEEKEKQNEDARDSLNVSATNIKTNKVIEINDLSTKNYRKKTFMPKHKPLAKKFHEKEGFNLDEAFTNKDNFLINQYKNPLLLNLGLGIKNLTFVDNNNSFKSFSKKANITRVMTTIEDDEYSEDNSFTSLVNEEEDDKE